MFAYQYPFVPLDCELLEARTRVCLVHQQVAQRPQSTPVCCMGETDEGPWGVVVEFCRLWGKVEE